MLSQDEWLPEDAAVISPAELLDLTQLRRACVTSRATGHVTSWYPSGPGTEGRSVFPAAPLCWTVLGDLVLAGQVGIGNPVVGDGGGCQDNGGVLYRGGEGGGGNEGGEDEEFHR
ncbi:hypothetical protein CVT25_007362 [Psilocybe cyanescens]|uniref:Uncharacterized protein n=1 Tax=Psilocybe cyanescens TaxID=93625 RepID=A0A409XJG4_PSICY|nr:hypothetical protein CVT25_007362 [Psilocybe cyanescens]